jgi:(2Fe-2S) ferredoxin
MMVHPDGIRYKHLDEAALLRIFQQHFLQDQPVSELIHDQFPRSVLAKREAARRARPRRRGRF